MAFVNEELTKEQRDEFMKRGIMHPDINIPVQTRYWTIDRERDICLIGLGTPRDFFESNLLNNTKFLFIWHKELAFFDLVRKRGQEHTVIWSIPDEKDSGYGSKYSYLYRSDCINDEFFMDLRCAIKVFGIIGWPEQENSSRSKNVIVTAF